MDSSCWKMKNVREQFRTHWPERIVGRKEEDVGQPCSRRLREVEDSFSCFLTAIFSPGEFQGKVREIDEREVALLGSLLDTILSVCHV